MTFYYFAGTDRIYSAYEIKRMTGLDPESGVGDEALAAVGVYRVIDNGNPHDLDFYTITRSYTVDYATLYATATYNETAILLADAKVVGERRAKEKAQAALERLGGEYGDGYGPLVLLAAAAQNASSRSADAQAKLDEIAQVLAAMLTNIADINAAADVPAIEAILADAARDSQALTAAQQKAIDGDDAAFGGIFSLSDGLTDAADDTAAAGAGVAVNQLYRNGSVVQIRVS
jgi:hypothetical protein